MINADDKLRAIFDGKDQVSMFEMTKHVASTSTDGRPADAAGGASGGGAGVRTQHAQALGQSLSDASAAATAGESAGSPMKSR